MLPPLTIAIERPGSGDQAGQGGRHGRGAGRLGDDLRLRKQPEDGVDDLLILDRDHIVHILLRVREGQVAGPDRHQAVGDARGLVERDRVTLCE